ncbi:hypothetical protein AKJ09_02752 [Labilithrix luteola]|uniref:Uncharacterized protein n=1 Tax=Labilithrix luteola TaxID=1391654 RepID=A0A0K1PRC8_9BACT|nr:hypothetical protein AKJ09_02752 [Labilithrix luteola]
MLRVPPLRVFGMRWGPLAIRGIRGIRAFYVFHVFRAPSACSVRAILSLRDSAFAHECELDRSTTRRRRRAGVYAAMASMACALTFGSSRTAAADDRADSSLAFTLAWDAPSTCPTRDEVDARVRELLAGSQRKETAQANVVVTHRRETWTAEIRTRAFDAQGRRTLSAASCDRLASATALVIALTIDPDLQVEPPAPPEPPPKPPEPATPAPSPAHDDDSSSLTMNGPRIGVRVAAVGGVGSLPSATGGVGLGLSLNLRPWRFEAYGEGWLPRSETASSPEGAGGDFSLLDVGVRGCVTSNGRIFVGACAGIEVDRVHAQGFGITREDTASRLWLAPEREVELEFGSPRVSSYPSSSTSSYPSRGLRLRSRVRIHSMVQRAASTRFSAPPRLPRAPLWVSRSFFDDGSESRWERTFEGRDAGGEIARGRLRHLFRFRLAERAPPRHPGGRRGRRGAGGFRRRAPTLCRVPGALVHRDVALRHPGERRSALSSHTCPPSEPRGRFDRHGRDRRAEFRRAARFRRAS